MRKKKERIILENILVEDYAAEGKSIARINGKVLFIEKAVPGDVVNVLLHRNKKDWAEGEAIAFTQLSPQREQPFCSHFGTCGGCSWQMLPYALQLQYKAKQVSDHLIRIAKINLPPFDPIVGAAETKGYRNKLEFTFSNKKYIPKADFKQLPAHEIAGNEVAGYGGFHAKGVFDKVVEIDTCYLQNEPANAIRKAIVAFGRQQNIPFYDARLHTGWLRNVMIRLARSGELMVNIVMGYEDKPLREALLQNIDRQFPEITTLLYTINPKFNDSIYDLPVHTWKGPGFIIETLEDFQFKIGPKSFFQTNTAQGEQLYRLIRELAELNGTQTVYDLYCGTGSIGIFVSKQAKKIVGVETVPEAIEDAKENAAINGIQDAAFFAGDVNKVCTDDFFEQNGRPDVIITDPPRAGMNEKLTRKLLDIAAPLVVYVSCNPATQARDLALLDEKYTVTKVQPVDMFPHTFHIENIVQLRLKEAFINP
ncbi:MAG: 23S rRNA (uracil(1939)-C(5))-methyltransferase RlmD [Hydrotalea flava]|nr:23S rRNA (uracil(1939)-C(5))-methyltransferase RlmD [Hydrotalea lipotrueae]MBY0346798.1 23S rRNA (uracil(1939)-C(5))-methyltransferase RlmD [Hydrotalea flava]NIM34997.1 23S rRNA (uracil(1939)-C(5))-methyltransferase RlmD [Hydrotalea flava]NIM37823.1 23S rRNA (uracil(1939)-C(5))-methyltransferase RlmD [Hydrotalea flava]NIN02992.1 23S rRNA (uracil(1939)-C(5))-methyltransferase RlmD [Hydrotalea flava]NIN14677.1 23S rRNA (uracil(1939)-C(5))-methyltransferase RlmD [Hydrotalea flava]